jgi:hypothetical protein
MNSLLHHLLFASLTATLCYLVHGLLVRLPLIRQFKMETDACRDRIQLGLLTGKFRNNDKALHILATRCRNARANLNKVDLTHILLTATSEHKQEFQKATADENKTIATGTPETQELAKHLDNIVLKSLAANSPLMALPGTIAFNRFPKTQDYILLNMWNTITFLNHNQ